MAEAEAAEYETPAAACSTGARVIFTDPRGVDHEALVTAGWSATCVNVVNVSTDESKTDTYGRQIERATSVIHASLCTVHGYYWRLPHEPKRPYTPPAAT